MPDQSFELDIFRDLLEGATTIAHIARDEKAFTTLYNAFRTADARTFQASLNQLGLFPRCRFICEWIRSKECVFLCHELCGPPRPNPEFKPDPRALAEIIVKFTSNPDLLHRLAAILDKRDRAGFGELAEQFRLGPYCHLFCHWVCTVRYRLMCRWVCSVDKIPVPNLVTELESAGHALRQLLAHKDAFDHAVAASNAGDPEKLGSIIRGAGILLPCHFICEWFCSWRCALVCTTFCIKFPIPVHENQVHEAFLFAQATAHLSQNPAQLQQLGQAVGAGNAGVYERLLIELKLQHYCIQLCHWICGLRCFRFCRLVCPPVYNHPWFTHVGDFGILADFDATGLTNKPEAAHGGPQFGFFGGLSLRGFCPKYDPAHPGSQMAYRFLYQPAGSATPTPITGGFVSEVLVGSRYALWNANPFTLQSVRIRGTGTTSPTPPVGPPGPTPPDHYIVPDPQGWVTVDSNALDDGFNGWLMGFASHVAFPGGAPSPGVSAGAAVPAGNQKNGANAAIIFQATRVSTIAAVNGGGAPDYTNQLSVIHINNWDEVNLINLQEFVGPGSCSPLSTDLHILYTTDHELLAGWYIDMVTAATIAPAPTFPSGTGPRGAASTDFHNISTWPTCSYLIRLHTRRSLTTGLVDDPDKYNFVTFCIGKK